MAQANAVHDVDLSMIPEISHDMVINVEPSREAEHDIKDIAQSDESDSVTSSLQRIHDNVSVEDNEVEGIDHPLDSMPELRALVYSELKTFQAEDEELQEIVTFLEDEK
jgi:hypothetical protein